MAVMMIIMGSFRSSNPRYGMHLKMSGRLLPFQERNEGPDGQIKRGMFLRLPPKLLHQMVGNSSAIGKSLSVAVIAIVLVWEVGEEQTQRDGNINSTIYNHRDDEESGFVV